MILLLLLKYTGWPRWQASACTIEQWDAICQFIRDLGKDKKTAPNSINNKRVAAMLTGVEKNVTKVLLELLASTIPLFEDFLSIFKRSSPTIHLLYDNVCLTLLKVMQRFTQPTAVEGKNGANNFLRDLNIPGLSEEEKLTCEGEITLEECSAILADFQTNKAPEIDSIPTAFYRKV